MYKCKRLQIYNYEIHLMVSKEKISIIYFFCAFFIM